MLLKSWDVVIIGAGAAGLMCAHTAAKRGFRVLVIDHANKAGKKILMSGGGRCNFINRVVEPCHFISHNPHFSKSALSCYTPDDFIALVKKHQIPFVEKTKGQLFCQNKSVDILNMLLKECEQAKVTLKLKTKVEGITVDSNHRFDIKTDQGLYQVQALVIATGGLSIPTMGASPFGYQVAEQFGLKVWPTRAGLVPFTWHQKDKECYETLSGVSVKARVQCGKVAFTDDLLFTHRGLSGPVNLQISSYWYPGESLLITLLPEVNLLESLLDLKKKKPNLSLKNTLQRYFPNNLVLHWCLEGELLKPLQSFSEKKLKAIADSFQAWQLLPNQTEGYRTAEVTLGGVDTDEVSSKTFEAKKQKGLYFIGEVLDVSGWLGGYNFGWAWSSAVACARSLK